MTTASPTTSSPSAAVAGLCTFSGWGTLVDIAICHWDLTPNNPTVIDHLVVLKTKYGTVTVRLEDPTLKSLIGSFDIGAGVWVEGIVQQFPNPKNPAGYYVVLTAHTLRACKPTTPQQISFDITGVVAGRSIGTSRKKENFLRRVVSTSHGEITCYLHRGKRKAWLITVGDTVHFAGTVRTSLRKRSTSPQTIQFFNVEHVFQD